jgi:hypothetical protein
MTLLFHVKKDLTPNSDELGFIVLFHIGEDPTKTHINLYGLNISRPKHFM